VSEKLCSKIPVDLYKNTPNRGKFLLAAFNAFRPQPSFSIRTAQQQEKSHCHSKSPPNTMDAMTLRRVISPMFRYFGAEVDIMLPVLVFLDTSLAGYIGILLVVWNSQRVW